MGLRNNLKTDKLRKGNERVCIKKTEWRQDIYK